MWKLFESLFAKGPTITEIRKGVIDYLSKNDEYVSTYELWQQFKPPPRLAKLYEVLIDLEDRGTVIKYTPMSSLGEIAWYLARKAYPENIARAKTIK
jgi:Fe2+ or Zn2+ uptake regulation protein